MDYNKKRRSDGLVSEVMERGRENTGSERKKGNRQRKREGKKVPLVLLPFEMLCYDSLTIFLVCYEASLCVHCEQANGKERGFLRENFEGERKMQEREKEQGREREREKNVRKRERERKKS